MEKVLIEKVEINAVLLIFFLRLLRHVMLCKNRNLNKMKGEKPCLSNRACQTVFVKPCLSNRACQTVFVKPLLPQILGIMLISYE